MSSRFFRGWGLLAGLLIIVAAVRLPGLFSRAIWYDETLTLLETAGHAAPAWPRVPIPAYVAQRQFVGTPGTGQIVERLRYFSVHPLIHESLLSLWRQQLGFSLETARAFSLVCSVASVLIFYLLLRAGHIPFPLVPTLAFGLTTFGVHMGHEARPYPLALLFILLAALFAYCSVDVAAQHRSRAVGYAVAAAICCDAAFGTHYLALFSVSVILIWHIVMVWPVSRWLAVLPTLAAIPAGLMIATVLLDQIGLRPQQFAGRPGAYDQIMLLLWMNLIDLHASMIPSKALQYLVWGLLALFGTFSIVTMATHWPTMESKKRRLLVLLLLLGVVPSVGLALLNLLFGKNLTAPRYVGFALPGLAALVAYGIVELLSSRRRLGILLALILVLAQLTGVNWGREDAPGRGDSILRSLTNAVEASPASPRIVVIGAGYGRGYPGSVIYELEPQTEVVVLYKNSDLDLLQEQVSGYAEVCVFLSMEDPTSAVENEFLRRIEEKGIYTRVNYNDATLCLRQQP
jgi:hypothetical protein